jgi:hypothetical protein
MSAQSMESNNDYSPTEIKVGDVWRGVLDLEGDFPPKTSSFLDLGGDSISAILCVSRLRNTFGPDLDIDLSDFFHDHSTIQNFATGIDSFHSTDLEKIFQASDDADS